MNGSSGCRSHAAQRSEPHGLESQLAIVDTQAWRWGVDWCLACSLVGPSSEQVGVCVCVLVGVGCEPTPQRLLHVQGLDGFRIMRLRSLPPVDLKDLNAAKLPPRGVVNVPGGQFDSLQQFAA